MDRYRLVSGSRSTGLVVLVALLVGPPGMPAAEERTESFDADPGWDAHNHRARLPSPRTIRQDFGPSPTHHAGGREAGELGGFITPAAEPAFVAKRIPERTLDDTLRASGKLNCTGRQFHVLVGFFNAETVNEWRTPNTVALRLYGRGEVFYAYVEYATSRWRAGGDTPRSFPRLRDPRSGREELKGFRRGTICDWSLEYDPRANAGRGAVTVRLGGESAVCHLEPGHRADGATFNRFGLLNVVKSADTGGELWLDDIAINGETETFSGAAGWDEYGNRRSYVTRDVRPRFDFGYSPTRHAGGRRLGELGGLVFRGDNRYPERMACYGDRLDVLTLERPLKASGRVALRRGVSDSTTLLGFFHSQDSMEPSAEQGSGIPRSFLGLAVEGPSREGFFVYPVYRLEGDGQDSAAGNDRPRILPDGTAHDWTLEYTPAGAGGGGKITVSLDGRSARLDLPASHRSAGARFDRFGIVTTWIDGNAQRIYFDDLRYTCR